jgi:hypothetical protein
MPGQEDSASASGDATKSLPFGPALAFDLGRRSVRSRGGWLVPLACGVLFFLLLCVVRGGLLASQTIVLGSFVGAAVVGMFVSFYAALWTGAIPWRRSGPPLVAALLWTLAISVLGIAFFAPLSFRLYNAHHLAVTSGLHDKPGHAEAFRTSWDFAKAYLWQTCDALPGLKVTDTVDWDPPLEHGTRMGLLLLAYRGFVLVPLVASLVGIWTSRRTGKAPSVKQRSWRIAGG